MAKNFLEDAELVIKSTNPTETIIKIIETRLYELIHGKDKDGNDIILDLYDINSTDVAKNSIIITLKAHQIRMEPPRISIKHKFPVRYTNLSMVAGHKCRRDRA